MSEDKLWEALEREIDKVFPGVRQTSGSGRIWGDGDRLLGDLCFEAKRHQRVNLDSWWEQTRQQAYKWNKIPILVVWRPPVKLPLGRSINEEVLAVCPLSYLGKLYTENLKLKKDLITLARANRELRSRLNE